MGVKSMPMSRTRWIHRLFLVILTQLLIKCGEAGQPPKILEHPADSVVPRNEPVTLNCKGEGDPAPTISWTKDGKALTQISDSRQLRFPLPSGSLFFLRVRSQDSGVYSCKATNSYGQVTSRDASLEVATLREDFRSSPQNTWIAQGETAILDCAPPRGNPEPKISWKKNGHLIDIRGSGYNILGLGSLTISDVREDDEGIYACVAKNIVGSRQSNLAHLRVTVRPQFTIVPANTSALLGSDVSLVCVARGDPPPEISWNKEKGNLPLKRARFDEERFLISNVSAEDGGVYRCIAENKAGFIESSATITILSPPVFTITPHDLELQPNSTAILECFAAGEPRPTLFWSKEGSHSIIFEGTSAQNLIVTAEGTLKIENVSERDEGFWFCAAVSAAGSIMHKIHLKVTPVEDYPPPIISIGAGNETKTIGSSVVMPCFAIGNPTPVITWYKDSYSFNLNHRIFTDAAGTLRISDISLDDAGMYECVASSRSGKYVWRSFLDVITPSEQQEKNDSNFKSVTYDATLNIEFVRPSPMKPRIVNVDSTSVTIAWHPKHFQSERDPHDLGSNQGLGRAQVSVDPGFRMPRSVKPKSFSTDRILTEGVKNKPLRPVPNFQLEEAVVFENLDSTISDIKLGETKTKKIEGEETDEDDDEYAEEKERFVTVIENLSEREYGEEEEQSNQNGNNLIIQSRRPSNNTKTRSSYNNSTNAAILLTTVLPFTDLQSTPLPPILPTRVPLHLNPAISIKKSHMTFNVEYYSAQEVKSEWLLGASVAVETVTLKYLKPNAEYIFFVRSVNAHGVVSPPSPLSDPVQTSTFSTRQNDADDVSKARSQLMSPVVVLLKTVYATSSTSVRLEWQIVTAGDFIEGFYVYFRPVPAAESDDEEEREHEGRNIGYQMLTVLNTGASNFQISGLEKFRKYQMFLIPFYKNVDGRPSNYRNVTTAQDVPSSAPEILGTSPVNTSAMMISWKPPSTKYHHGILLGYQLRVWSGPFLVGNLTTNAETNSVILNNMTKGHSSSLQIAAFTIKGIGTFSSMKTLNFYPDGFSKTIPSSGNNDRTNQLKDKSDKDNEDSNHVIEYPGRRSPGLGLSHDDVPNEFLTEAWFITLIGSVIFLMLLVFVFALYMRRFQLRKEMDKFEVSTTEIPDGSMPPRYTDDNLWIDSQQSKQLSLKCGKVNDSNEYENGNNYAVVQDQHSPIAYATTTLVNGEKHKSAAFGDSGKCLGLLISENGGVLGSHLVSRSNASGMMTSSKMGGWMSNIATSSCGTVGFLSPASNRIGSLNTCSPDINKDTRNGASFNVLSTFHTSLPGRKEIVVDFSNSGQHPVKSSILKYPEPRLNPHSQILPQHSQANKSNFSLHQTNSGDNSCNSNIF